MVAELAPGMEEEGRGSAADWGCKVEGRRSSRSSVEERDRPLRILAVAQSFPAAAAAPALCSFFFRDPPSLDSGRCWWLSPWRTAARLGECGARRGRAEEREGRRTTGGGGAVERANEAGKACVGRCGRREKRRDRRDLTVRVFRGVGSCGWKLLVGTWDAALGQTSANVWLGGNLRARIERAP